MKTKNEKDIVKDLDEVIQKLNDMGQKDETADVPPLEAFRQIVHEANEMKQKSIRRSNLLFACVALLFLAGFCAATMASQVVFIIIQCAALIPLPFVIVRHIKAARHE